MKNIYDIRTDEKLLFVLSDDESDKEAVISKNAAVIINLYYLDTVDKYISYINNVPCSIPVYVYSSNRAVIDYLEAKPCQREVFCAFKENRGRDISALLVAAADVIRKYDYICFLHDKSANADYLMQDVERWIENLWGNMLASEGYISKVLKEFENNPQLGLLAPPEPYGDYFYHWYGDTWEKNYDAVLALSKDLELNADIDSCKSVFTLGTVFWGRTAALEKLFERGWKYDDFMEEPLPVDGTLSHAIERIFGYVAQDAGYKTGTVMTAKYAAEMLIKVQEDMRTMYSCLKERMGLHDMHQIKTLADREALLKAFVKDFDKIYIYGAGDYAAKLCDFMTNNNCRFEGFVVSTGRKKDNGFLGRSVIELQALNPDDNVGIIIGVSYQYREEIERELTACGFKNYIYGF